MADEDEDEEEGLHYGTVHFKYIHSKGPQKTISLS